MAHGYQIRMAYFCLLQGQTALNDIHGHLCRWNTCSIGRPSHVIHSQAGKNKINTICKMGVRTLRRWETIPHPKRTCITSHEKHKTTSITSHVIRKMLFSRKNLLCYLIKQTFLSSLCFGRCLGLQIWICKFFPVLRHDFY